MGEVSLAQEFEGGDEGMGHKEDRSSRMVFEPSCPLGSPLPGYCPVHPLYPSKQCHLHPAHSATSMSAATTTLPPALCVPNSGPNSLM